MKRDQVTKSIISKVIETASTQLLNLVVGIILARVLSPSDYGIYGILLIFTSISQTIIAAGLNSALIQRIDVEEGDYSTVFTVSLIVAAAVYVILFIMAPCIAKIYKVQRVIVPLRVILLVLFPSALYSVVQARVARKMEFPFIARISVFTVVINSAISIFLALNSAGVWALVVQLLLTYTLVPLFYCSYYRWMPKLWINKERLKMFFGFASKVLIVDIVNAIYANVQGMIIGIKYNTESLAFFNKGQMFPRTIMQTVNGSVENVLFPVYSDMQDVKSDMGKMLYENMRMISFVVFPMMMGIFAVSTEMIELLLTEKWIACVGIVRIYCVAYMFWPIDSMNLQAIKACGDGDVYLKLNIGKKIVTCGIVVVAVLVSRTVEMFALSAIIGYILDVILGSFAMKKCVGISLFQEIVGVWRSAVCSGCILVVMFLPRVNESVLFTLVYKIIIGGVVYILSSYILNRNIMMPLVKRVFGKINRK